MSRTLFFAAILLAVAAPALAQESVPHPVASGSITIERPLTVASVQPMSFSPVSSRAEAAVTAKAGEAVIRITGDPGRVYRVTLPDSILAQPGGLTVDSFTIVSDNSGDITSSLTARMDSTGRDRLRISGLLRDASGLSLSDVTAAVPVGVDYE
ncbi:hypothetical protein GGQ87_001947 [Brevundimonas alba]|uniref:Uncharacterized protein n=1 Tax=Brevundimonas alba TaxID=74314 RepID=A0A7X6BP78_9CAUL|nr:DUF4402 domain-containing protein [Brevundimonas alba]NJC41689.1 hypothetical protein [Brevundimonas alba]